MIFKEEKDIYKAIKLVETVPEWIISAREYHKDMKALLYGDKFTELLIHKIEHLESEKKAKARRKYSRPIKDVNNKLLEPVSNVYSATGGSKEFPELTEINTKTIVKQLANVRGGLSLERWLQTFWSKDLYNADPSGLIFLEWKDEKAYPTYKSIDKIRYYLANGQNCEYVIFEPKAIPNSSDKQWRVVDDSKDYTIIQRGDSYIIDEVKTIDNPFFKCPTRINSDKERFGQLYRLAPIDSIIETQKELARDRSIKTNYKFLNGFSTPYKPKIVCPECHGTKKNGTQTCSGCNGKGVVLDKDVTDEIIIPITLNTENQPSLPTNFAGFISPDLEIWNQYTDEEKLLFNQCFETIWGTRESEEVKDQTAQGVILNTQPMTSRLNQWSDIAQSQEWFFTELLINFYLEKNHENKMSIITYGRNYIIQPPEFLLKQYQESKDNKDPVTILDRKLTEYLTSKYKNDPDTLRKQLIKKTLEPYVHYDIELVKDIYGQKEAQKKGLFTDWWESLSDFSGEISKLEADRDKWTNEALNKLNINNDGNSSSKEV